MPPAADAQQILSTQWQHLLYTDPQVNFVMQGSLIDAESRTDITAQRLEELNRVAFSSLPLDLARPLTGLPSV